MLVLGTALAMPLTMPAASRAQLSSRTRHDATLIPVQPRISVVVSTYNRAPALSQAIDRLVTQRTHRPYEVIVIDNNSTDGTATVIHEATRRDPSLVRAGFEPRQGVSHGRNRGIELSRAPIVAFTDDDVLVTPYWLERLAEALDEHPEVDCVGGRVLPVWRTPPPRWVTRQHWSPLALVDYGDAPFYVDHRRAVCLVTANVAYRRSALDAIGWFSPEFPRCQDHELLLRLWRQGRRGLYLPSLVVMCEVPAARLTWRYHRRWHVHHGRFLARMPDEAVVSASRKTPAALFGAPAICYREFARYLVETLVSRGLGRSRAARHAEGLALQYASFILARGVRWVRSGSGTILRKFFHFLAWLSRRAGTRQPEPHRREAAQLSGPVPQSRLQVQP